MSPLCRAVCESVEETSLVFMVSSHKLFMELLSDEERKTLVEQMKKRSASINLSAKPLPSFYDIPGTPKSQCMQLIYDYLVFGNGTIHISTGRVPL